MRILSQWPPQVYGNNRSGRTSQSISAKAEVSVSKVSWQEVAKPYLTPGLEVGSDDFDLSVQASGVERATNVLLLDDTVIEAQLARLDSWLLRTHDVSRLVLLLGLTGQQPSRALQELQFWSSCPQLHRI